MANITSNEITCCDLLRNNNDSSLFSQKWAGSTLNKILPEKYTNFLKQTVKVL